MDVPCDRSRRPHRRQERSPTRQASGVCKADPGADIELRQIKCLSNIAERDHRDIECIVPAMLGCKTVRRARVLIAGIERILAGTIVNLASGSSRKRSSYFRLQYV